MTSITLQNNQWRVSGDIMVDNASTVLRESLGLTMPDNLIVDFAEVTGVDTAALSLLMEWQRRAKLSNQQVTFTNLPESLVSLAALYGVTDFINVHRH